MRFLAAVLCLVLGACEGLQAAKTDATWGYQPQSCQGLNCYWAGVDDAGNPYIVAYSGKEQDTLSVEGSMFGAPFTYEASGIKAFDGQQFQAQVQQVIAAETGLTGRALADLAGRITSLAIQAATGGIGAAAGLSDGIRPTPVVPAEPIE